MSAGWLDDDGLVTMPSGVTLRGRRIGASVSPADFALVLADGPLPAWSHRRVDWPDFWIPRNRADALAALHEAYGRAQDGERVEVMCLGGRGRTGTALAAIAILDGIPVKNAVGWIREHYNRHAVETPLQRLWLRTVR